MEYIHKKVSNKSVVHSLILSKKKKSNELKRKNQKSYYVAQLLRVFLPDSRIIVYITEFVGKQVRLNKQHFKNFNSLIF